MTSLCRCLPRTTFVFTCPRSLKNPPSLWCPTPDGNLSRFRWRHIPFWHLRRSYKAQSGRVRCFWLSSPLPSLADSQVSHGLSLFTSPAKKTRQLEKPVKNYTVLVAQLDKIHFVCIMMLLAMTLELLFGSIEPIAKSDGTLKLKDSRWSNQQCQNYFFPFVATFF